MDQILCMCHFKSGMFCQLQVGDLVRILACV